MESKKMNLKMFDLINFSKSSGRGYYGRRNNNLYGFSSIASNFASNLSQYDLELGEEIV